METNTFIKVGDTKTTKVDVRIIAATNRQLASATNQQPRLDLYYRLSVFDILLPPLRDRRQDIPLLAQTFLHQIAQSNQKKISGMTNDFVNHLIRYGWKGNIRELRNVVEQAIILSNWPLLTEEMLPFELK